MKVHFRLFLPLLFSVSSGTFAEEGAKPVLSLPAAEEPAYGPDSMAKEDVEHGTIRKFEWSDSKVFPGTKRTVQFYLPPGADASVPLPLMVFQDGHAYLGADGDFRVPVVLDNLIAAGELPAMVAIFIDPGNKGPAPEGGPWRNNNRSFEYDTLSGDYADLVINEILPEVAKVQALCADPEMRAICGTSSGGICAWTVAWQRPDQFRKVLSSIGSFTNIRGGDAYPGMIRKTEKKPIRAIFQEGIHDLDNEHGNWPLGNMQMQAALEFKGYDFKYIWGTGAHSGHHAGTIFPEMMKWLWRK